MIFISIIAVLILCISIFTFHKVRQIHLMNYEIKEYQRTESVNQFRQLQSYQILLSKLNLKSELPLLRGWAASPDFLLIIADHALNSKPETVVECSSGSSTIILARCMQLNKSGHVYSFEHDQFYAQKTREQLKRHDLE